MRVYLESLLVGLVAAFAVGLIWMVVGGRLVASTTVTPVTSVAPPEKTPPSKASIPAVEPDDIHVATMDTIVETRTTTYAYSPFLPVTLFAVMLLTSMWTMWSLRRSTTRGH